MWDKIADILERRLQTVKNYTCQISMQANVVGPYAWQTEV